MSRSDDDLGSTAGIGPNATTSPLANIVVAAPGAQFGRFVMIGALGRGGMGVVLSAVDPRLDRKVALKLLSERSAHLLEREAQALAQLAHPNVVSVYEIGYADDQPFIAMELVDGTTLRAWLDQAPRGWREIVAMFVAAGRGLAAAHASGITHRDFKPDNVLIGRDGRPRVSDFGIATSTRGAALAGAALERSASSEGVPVGTPAYMAPEQWAGGETDARTDQFAFAVALWAALYGERPFPGETAESLRDAVVAGRYRRPAQPGRAPRWILALLARALAVAPAQRWPTLTELLDRLERGAPARHAHLAVSVGLALAGVALVVATQPAADPCAPPDARVAQMWGVRRATTAVHVAAVDPTYGAQRFDAVASALDPGVGAWRAMHVDACRANRVAGTQSDRVLDLRMRCLADWLETSDRVVAGLAAAPGATAVEAAVHAVSTIPRLERCADLNALARTEEPPRAPADRLESDAIRAEVVAMQAKLQRNELGGLAAWADAVVERARRLGHPFTLSRALGARARIAVAERATDVAVGLLREQIEVAARGNDDDEFARAWASLLHLVALLQGHAPEARAMFLAADAAVARVADRPELVAEILNSEAEVLVETGEVDAALARIADTQRMLEAAGARTPGSPLLRNLAALARTAGDAYYAKGQLVPSAASAREAIALYTRMYGPDNLDSGNLQLTLAQIVRDQGRLDEAEVAARAAVRSRAQAGETASLASAQAVLCDMLARRGRVAEAIELGERAVALGRRTMAPSDPTLTVMIEIVADAYDAAGQLPRALALYDDTLATFARAGVRNYNVASGLIIRGGIARRMGQCAGAIAGLREAAALARELQGDAGHTVGVAIRDEGLCLAQLGRDAEAIATLQRGLAFDMPEVEAEQAEPARGVLGRLLVTTRRDVAGGEAMVRSAVAKMRASASSDPLLAELEAWLAAR